MKKKPLLKNVLPNRLRIAKESDSRNQIRQTHTGLPHSGEVDPGGVDMFFTYTHDVFARVASADLGDVDYVAVVEVL